VDRASASVQSLLLQVGAEVEEKTLRAALQVLIDHHDALRLRRRTKSGKWKFEVAPIGTVSARSCLQRREIISLSEDERRRVIGEEAQEAEQRCLRMPV